jgi:CRISPR/Cas system-associated exonuclease Cas4 (RecB family)
LRLEKPIRMSFHKWKDFKECPKRFYYKETKVPYPKEENKYNTLMGNTVQKFFEKYSNEWKKEDLPWSRELVVDRIEKYWKKQIAFNYINWKDFYVKYNEQELFNLCVDIILDNLKNFDVYDNTRSEVKFEVKLKSGDVLVGIMDFIKKGNLVEILDGKATDVVGKNIKIEQLYMYAFLYELKYGKLPDKMGYLYYRMRMIDYAEIDREKIDLFKKEIIYTLYKIKKMDRFEATPSAKACKYCPYKSTCEEHLADAKTRKRKSSVKDKYNGDVLTMDF